MAPGPKRLTSTTKPSKHPKTKSTNSSKSKTTSKSTTTSKAKGKRPSTASNLSSTSSIANSPIPSTLDSPIPSHLSSNPSHTPSPEPDFILAEIIPEDSTPKIPPELVLRLLQHSFQDKGTTKINKEAAGVMGKYVEVFVREALARCAFSRGERERDGGLGSVDGFLEVEDLERVGGQIVLDF